VSRHRASRRWQSDGTAWASPPRRRFLQAAVACGSFWFARPSLAVEDASAPVERLHQALLTAAAEGDTARARYEHLLPVVSDVFDFRAMSRGAVGRAWSDFSEEERAALVEHFAAYATANYAENFDDAGSISFRTLAVEPGRGKRVHVETELVRSNEEAISFDYVVFRGADGPHIINVVVAETMNEFARRRSEFRALLGAGGLQHLLETLERQKQQALVS